MKYDHLDLNQRVRLAEIGNKDTLDELVYDSDYRVRELVANHGYRKHLNILIKDPHPTVRGEVAGCGHKQDLEILINDENDEVMRFATKILNEKNGD